MVNRSSGLTRSAFRWAFQVSTSLGATLLAALIVQALPRAVPAAPAPAPELTSGGKFAARVASARAYDGLDTMPLPHVEALRVDPPAAVVPAAFLASSPADLGALGAVLRQSAGDPPSVRDHAKPARLARAAVRAEVRRTTAPGSAAAASPGGRDGAPAEIATADAADDGLLHEVASKTRAVWSTTSATTHSAWTATASVGSSLVSRLIP